MSISISSPRTFGVNEIPNRASLLAGAAVVLSGLDLTGVALSSGLGKAYVNGLWPKYGDEGVAGLETCASGFQEGTMLLDVGGRWWIHTRWGATKLAPWGGLETKRFPLEDVNASFTGIALALALATASNTGGSAAWKTTQSTLRTMGVLQSSGSSMNTIPSDQIHPRVALFGLVALSHTGASITLQDRVNLAEPSWYGGGIVPTSQNVTDSASHVMAEGVGEVRASDDPTDPLYVQKVGGVFFGGAVPAVGSGVSP